LQHQQSSSKALRHQIEGKKNGTRSPSKKEAQGNGGYGPVRARGVYKMDAQGTEARNEATTGLEIASTISRANEKDALTKFSGFVAAEEDNQRPANRRRSGNINSEVVLGDTSHRKKRRAD